MSWFAENHEFTRQEFYKLVWSKSTTAIAEELGCSDTWIKKICRKHKILKPGLGYWAKIRSGQKPKKTPLPACGKHDLQRIVITVKPQSSKVKPMQNAPEKSEAFDPDILALLAKAKRLGPIEVKEVLQKPHPLVRDTRECLKRIDKHTGGLPQYSFHKSKRVLNTYLSSGTVDRAMRIMDALIKRIERLGGEIRIEQKGYGALLRVIAFAGEDVGEIRIKERHTQLKRRLTKKEVWDPHNVDKKFHIEYVPSGKLLLDDGSSYSQYCYAKDTDDSRTLETKLVSVIEKLICRAGRSRMWKRQREAERIAYEKEMTRLEEMKRFQKLEKERVEKLLETVENWHKSVRIRGYLADFRAFIIAREGEFPDSGPDAEYYDWASEQADRFDPFKRSPGLILDENSVRQ